MWAMNQPGREELKGLSGYTYGWFNSGRKATSARVNTVAFGVCVNSHTGQEFAKKVILWDESER
jgi:hypothetical protein